MRKTSHMDPVTTAMSESAAMIKALQGTVKADFAVVIPS